MSSKDKTQSSGGLVEIPLTAYPPQPRGNDGSSGPARDAVYCNLGPHVVELAKEYTDAEDARGTKQTFVLWRWSVIWSILIAFCLVMEGYDLALMPNFFSLSSFKRKFGDLGYLDPPGPIPVLTQSLILLASQCGQIAGIYFSGWAIEKFGYRPTVITALITGTCFISISFFSVNIWMVLAGELVLGVPWGTFQASTLPYVADLCPQKLRPVLTTGINLCWVVGQLAASGTIKLSLFIHDDTWAYRMPILCQWVVPPVLALIVYFAPESPLWLIRHGKLEQAEHVVARLTSADPNFNASAPVASMRADNEKEKAYRSGMGYSAVFQGVNLRRTEIAVMCNLTQQWCGSHLMFYSAKVYQMGGIPEETSFTFNLIQYGVAVAGVITSWVLMRHVGRRTIWISALSAQLAILATVGTLGFFIERSPAFSYAAGSLLLVFSLVYNMSIGPVCYSIIAEVPSTRLKAKTGVVARNVYNLAGIFNLFMGPKMLEQASGGGWGWGVKTAFFWAGMCALCMGWALFRLPELRGRRPSELEVLFEKKVPAWMFARMTVDAFDHTVTQPDGTPYESASDADDSSAYNVKKGPANARVTATNGPTIERITRYK